MAPHRDVGEAGGDCAAVSEEGNAAFARRRRARGGKRRRGTDSAPLGRRRFRCRRTLDRVTSRRAGYLRRRHPLLSFACPVAIRIAEAYTFLSRMYGLPVN